MATTLGAITSSHVPSIGGAIAKGLQQDPYWKPFFGAFPPVHAWLARTKPDVAVVFYNDHGLNFDGQRAGFINKAFDAMCMEAIVDDPESLTRYSTLDLVREAGAQGTELMTWLAARGALTGRVTRVHSGYHVPISNTAAASMVLENEPRPAPQTRAA